jgi:hypothetical protein
VGFTGLAEPARVGNLQLKCAKLSQTSPTSGALTVGPVTSLKGVGDPGSIQMKGDCPPGQVARGQLVRVGSWVDAYQMICGVPTVAP